MRWPWQKVKRETLPEWAQLIVTMPKGETILELHPNGTLVTTRRVFTWDERYNAFMPVTIGQLGDDPNQKRPSKPMSPQAARAEEKRAANLERLKPFLDQVFTPEFEQQLRDGALRGEPTEEGDPAAMLEEMAARAGVSEQVFVEEMIARYHRALFGQEIPT